MEIVIIKEILTIPLIDDTFAVLIDYIEGFLDLSFVEFLLLDFLESARRVRQHFIFSN